MNLDSVSYPALVIADDGWIQFVRAKRDLGEWTLAAIKKYSRRNVILYDRGERLWRIKTVTPRNPQNAFSKAMAAISNRKLPVNLQLEHVSDGARDALQDALYAAIDADDDILTQTVTSAELKSALSKAGDFSSVVATIRRSGAIEAE